MNPNNDVLKKFDSISEVKTTNDEGGLWDGDLFDQMRKSRYRPAYIAETKAFGNKFPDLINEINLFCPETKVLSRNCAPIICGLDYKKVRFNLYYYHQCNACALFLFLSVPNNFTEEIVVELLK